MLRLPYHVKVADVLAVTQFEIDGLDPLVMRPHRAICLPESTPIEEAAHQTPWSKPSMPTGPRGEKRPRDVIGTAVKVVKILKGEIEEDIDPKKSAAAVELGSRGGKARASRLTPEQRKEIARRAAIKRWQKRRDQST